MDFLDKLKKRIELNKAKEENRAFAEKFGSQSKGKNVPAMYTGNMQDDKVAKEIKGTATGETIAFEREDGSWVLAGMDYYLTHKDEHGKSIISKTASPLTEEYEALKNMSYPTFNGSTGL